MSTTTDVSYEFVSYQPSYLSHTVELHHPQHPIDDHYIDQQPKQQQQQQDQQSIEHEVEIEQSDVDEGDNNNSNNNQHEQLLPSQLQPSQFNIHQQDVIQSPQIEPDDQNGIVVVDNIQHKSSNSTPQKCKSLSGYIPQPRHQAKSSKQHPQHHLDASVHTLQHHNTNQNIINNINNTEMNSKLIVNSISPISILPQQQPVKYHQQQQQQQILQNPSHSQIEHGVLSSLHGSFSPEVTIHPVSQDNVPNSIPKPIIIMNGTDDKRIEHLEQQSLHQSNTTSNIIQSSSKLQQKCDQVLELQSKDDLQSKHTKLQLQQQQFELKQQQFELKQQQFELQCERREFELQQKQEQFKFQQKQKQFERREFQLTQQQNLSNTQFHELLAGFRQDVQEVKDLVATNANKTCVMLDEFEGKIQLLQTDVDVKLNEFATRINHQPNSINGQLNEFATRIDDQSNNIDGKINELKTHVNTQTSNIKIDLDSKITQISTRFNNQMNSIKTDLDSKLSEFTTSFTNQTNGIQLDLDDKMNEFKISINDHANNIKTAFSVEMNEFKSTLVQATNDLATTGDKIDQLESACQEQIDTYQRRIKMIENQRQQIPLILAENAKEDNEEYEYVCFQIETMPEVVNFSCCNWGATHLDVMLRVMDDYLQKDLSPHKTAIEIGKLYISTKSVLNGEWFQIRGDGKVIDIKQIKIHQLIKPGDDVYDYKDYPCSKNCSRCKGTGLDKTEKRFLIKFKWE